MNSNNSIIIRNLRQNNLKNVSLDIPKGKIVVFTGVSGSGKSSIVFDTIAAESQRQMNETHPAFIRGRLLYGADTPDGPRLNKRVEGVSRYLNRMLINRDTSTMSSAAARRLMQLVEEKPCPACGGRGATVTELAFMDPVATVCEVCEGKRYSAQALSYLYKGKSIVDILDMSAADAYEFFAGNKKLRRALGAMLEVGLPYLSLGQPLSTLSGGERQRVKLAKELDKKGGIYVLDEPTTGLHASDVKKVMELLDGLVARGNTVIVIEHNTDVMKQADWIIDVGPDGGSAGGEVVFTGTPREMAENSRTITAEYLRRAL